MSYHWKSGWASKWGFASKLKASAWSKKKAHWSRDDDGGHKKSWSWSRDCDDDGGRKKFGWSHDRDGYSKKAHWGWKKKKKKKECEDECEETVVDFENFKAGDVVSTIQTGIAGLTIAVSGLNGERPEVNAATIFDTDNPTGGDVDLTGTGNVLIINDGDPGDVAPDDEENGGQLNFTFSDEVNLTSINIVDTEEGGQIEAFADGVSLGMIDIPEVANGEIQTVDLSMFDNVDELRVTLDGSGAIDDLALEACPDKPAPKCWPASKVLKCLKQKIKTCDKKCKEVTIDFEDLDAGDTVSSINTGVRGLTIDVTGENAEFAIANSAMIFDTDNPTGGDTDLTGGGNVLIIADDGPGTTPDDEENGGTLIFNFSRDVNLDSLELLDTEEGGEIEVFDNGALIGSVDIPEIGNAETQTIDLSAFDSVDELRVTFDGSGALDDLELQVCRDHCSWYC